MKIWSAWLQGRKNAPAHVQKIFSLWEELNPKSDFVVLENSDVESILDTVGVNYDIMSPQVKTNIARIYLVSKYGGTWVDSTLLPTMPLDHWLTPQLRQEGFFAFRSTGLPELVLQNWFMYGEQNNTILTNLLESYCEYFSVTRYPPQSRKIMLSLRIFDYFRYKYAKKLKDPLYFVDPDRGRSCRMYPYAFLNFSLYYILNNDPLLARSWSNVPTLFHILPSLVGHCAMDAETSDETFYRLALDLLPNSPVHKLNYRDPRFSILIDQARSRGLIEFGDRRALG